MFATVIRTVFIYIFLIAVMRLTGKRQIGQMQPSELIAAFLLSELAALPISDITIPLVNSVIPIAVIITLEVVISFLAGKIPFLKKAVDGTPSIVIRKGVIDEKELDRLRLSVDELLSELRLENIGDINEVEYAVLEENGQLSIMPKSDNLPFTRSDAGIKKAEKGFSHPLIMNGYISKFNLKFTGKDKKWVISKLKGRKIKDIMLMTLDDTGNINIVEKEKKK